MNFKNKQVKVRPSAVFLSPESGSFIDFYLTSRELHLTRVLQSSPVFNKKVSRAFFKRDVAEHEHHTTSPAGVVDLRSFLSARRYVSMYGRSSKVTSLTCCLITHHS